MWHCMAQEVALLDVRKEVSFCAKAGCKILGVVENMAGFCCPHCHNVTDIFPPSEQDATGAALRGGEAMARAVGVPFLGRIPLDPLLSRACEAGTTVRHSAALLTPRVLAHQCSKHAPFQSSLSNNALILAVIMVLGK